jgi:hypothetical protein
MTVIVAEELSFNRFCRNQDCGRPSLLKKIQVDPAKLNRNATVTRCQGSERQQAFFSFFD